jgi:hypothetical protein
VYGYRKGSREPRYLDDEEIRRRDEEQKEEVEEYNRFRDQVKQWRDSDKQNRNQIKIRQLEECEELQVRFNNGWFGCFMMLNATFNNISVISWWSVLLVEETRVPGENHQSAASL